MMSRGGSDSLIDVSQDDWVDSLPDRRVDLAAEDAREIAEFALTLGVQMLTSGFDTASTLNGVRGCARSYGLDVSAKSVGRTLIVDYKVPGQAPVAMTRSAGKIDELDLRAMESLHHLLLGIVQKSWTISRCKKLLAQGSVNANTWPWWVTLGGTMVLAASIALRTGSGWYGALLASFAVFLSDRAGLLLSRWGVPEVFVISGRAAIVASVGMLLTHLGLATSGGAAAIVATGLVTLLPIPALIQATSDAVGYHYVGAAARFTAMLVNAIMLMVGTSLVLGWGAQSHPAGHRFIDDMILPWWVIIVASAVGGLGNAFALGASSKVLVPAAIVSTIAGAANVSMADVCGAPPALAAGISAAVLGVVSSGWAVRLQIPRIEMCIIGFTGALTPGTDLQKAIDGFFWGAPEAVQHWATVVAVAVAIGLGLVFGTWIVQRLRTGSARTTPHTS